MAVAGRGLVDPEGPVFRADDEALLRGGAAFETVRSYAGVPFLLDRHIRRFRFSIDELALPPADGLAELVDLVTGAAPPDHVLRLYRTDRELVATAASLPGDLEEIRARGLALRSVDIGAPAPLLAGAKTTSYGEAFAARRLAEREGADEALLVADGLVLEAATANIWWRCGDELSPTAEVLIGRVAAVLADAPNQVRVEGHTDDVPIHTWRFNSNWDLSTARATRVVEFLSSRAGIAPARLSAAGYGEFHPRASNDTAASRARNRRVDIVVLNDATAAAEEPGSPASR